MKLEERRTEYVLTIDNAELNQIYWALKQCDCLSCSYMNKCKSILGDGGGNCHLLAEKFLWETATPRYKADA